MYTNHAKELRKRAEEALRGNPVDLDGLATEDIQHLLHELQVHQAELTIQNEELRRVQFDLEGARDLYSELFEFAPAGYCTLSQKGRILNANQTLADLLGEDQAKLLNRPLSDFVNAADQDEYYLHFQRAMKEHQRAVSEIRLEKPAGGQRVVRIESVVARGDPSHLLVMLSDITDQRRLEENQQKNAVQIELQRHLLDQSEKERGELARNLHDGPLQSVSSLGFSLQILKENLKCSGVEGNENIQQMAEEIINLSAELRGICYDLRPPVLSRFGLRRALQQHAENFHQKHTRTRIKLEFSDDPKPLPEKTALALYRIYQQALSNIIRHTEATEVWVRLKLDPQQVCFEIQDNGQGIPYLDDWNEYARQGHLGIVGMRERAEAIGGTMQLVSQPGKGTIVQVAIPLAD